MVAVSHPDSATGLVCPGCGQDDLLLVIARNRENVACPACASCWHIEPGSVERVWPATCGGCRLAGWCRAAQFALVR